MSHDRKEVVIVYPERYERKNEDLSKIQTSTETLNMNKNDEFIVKEESNFEEASNESEMSNVTDTAMSKPKMSYAKLISEALLNSSNGMLILSDIHKSISARHPYYQMNVSGWKNAVRQTLTLNKSFVKSSDKRGSYWKLSENQEEKGYTCGTCDASFTFESSMKRHIATVHEGAKPYKCSFCDRCYAEKRNLNGHVSKHHRKRHLKTKHVDQVTNE